ncbi:MAG: ABC transporter permease [Bryobacterales bacterium]|nr:ABC transporter permease [Bryobacterales bacterium]
MRTYTAYIRTTMKLVMRDRVVLFFNYFLPLAFFIVFAQSLGAAKGGTLTQIMTMVFIFGVLGSGFFGAGMRAVQERELNILRRFKVAPITPLPILVASLVTGLLSYLPSVFIILAIASVFYGMPWPEHWIALMALLSLGLAAFRSIGLIIGAVVNSMQESQIIIQILYLPMLFLSGATFPINVMPTWLQVAAQFLPASYLYTGLQGILVQNDTLMQNLAAIVAMTVTMIVSTFLGVKLFRWEKDEKMPGSAKLWVLAVLLPFLLLGGYQAHSRENVGKAKILYREMRRSGALLIRGARIVTGDGKDIPNGAVLLKKGKIERIFETPPAEKDVKADVVEAAGKTLLPGLMDAHVHLMLQGGVLPSYKDLKPNESVGRELAAYLYSGVIAVKSAGDPPPLLERPKALAAKGEKLGAELFITGKTFTAAGGFGTEYLKSVPKESRAMVEQQTLNLPKTPEEARRQAAQIKQAGLEGVKILLETGQSGALFNRLDLNIVKAICDQAREDHLPVAIRTGDARDVADAVAAGATVIEHGSARDAIPDEVFAAMAKQGVAYDPMLSGIEAALEFSEGRFTLLDRTLVQQVAPEGLIKATKALLKSPKPSPVTLDMDIAAGNLRRAWKAGVTLVTGSDAGNFLLVHGPGIHRELQLWVKAGIPPATALQAATTNTARLLRIDGRSGRIRPGFDASLLLVDGNPLEDINATERISAVFFKGERVDRAALFDKE